MRPSVNLRNGVVGALLFVAPAVADGQTPSPQSVGAGRTLFETRCAPCHSLGDERLIGPGLAGIGERRERAWLTGFIAAPDRMLADGDPIATELLAEYQVPMPNLGISVAEAESILDYLATTSAPATSAAGAVCTSCHTTAGLGRVGGGTLAKDLTHVAAVYGDGLRAVLEASPFPAMQAAFGDRPLTAAEIADISAFLVEVNRQETARAESPVLFLMTGLVGAALLMALAGVIWRGRLSEVRESLIGGSR
jgi:mono/diheme cytochrome c family protein